MDGSVATTVQEGHNERRLTPGLPIVVILGATATGKSQLALDIAQRFGGEIVSADSRYLYRGMDFGTAKPDAAELASVPHHLVDIVDPEEDYSLAMWLGDAYAAVESIAGRARLPLVAGGTPLYLRAFLEGWTIPQVPPAPELRARLEQLDADEIYRLVEEVDPVSATRIGRTNLRRLVRAREVYEVAGRPLSELEGRNPPPYRLLVLGLRQDRETLYPRIDERVSWMFANGLLDEARWLVGRGVPEHVPAMSAIGYREAIAVVRDGWSLDEAIETTCISTHRYVRHQETWFRRFEGITWLDSSDPSHSVEAIDLVGAFLGPNLPARTDAASDG